MRKGKNQGDTAFEENLSKQRPGVKKKKKTCGEREEEPEEEEQEKLLCNT